MVKPATAVGKKLSVLQTNVMRRLSLNVQEELPASVPVSNVMGLLSVMILPMKPAAVSDQLFSFYHKLITVSPVYRC